MKWYRKMKNWPSSKKYIMLLLLLGVGIIMLPYIGIGGYGFSAIPVVDGPDNMVVAAPYTGTLSWTVNAENNSGAYKILRESVVIENGTWVDGDVVNISVSEPEVGTYEYMIIFTDTAMYNISSVVMLNVYEASTMPPNYDNRTQNAYDDEMLVLYVLVGGTILAGIVGGVVGVVQKGRLRK